MRSFTHWTPAYIYSRLADYFFRFQNPKAPWLTPRAIAYLEQALQPDFSGMEYGSGRSTAWFARQVKHLVSVEHNETWYTKVRAELESSGLTNVEYHHYGKPDDAKPLPEKMASNYAVADAGLLPKSLNFVLVDGIERPSCALRALPLLKNGGLLIIDDANHYLPCNSWAPNSRSLKDGPLDTEWASVLDAIKSWDAVWFGNGVKETAVFHKPDTL
jgi:hypothetical protein